MVAYVMIWSAYFGVSLAACRDFDDYDKGAIIGGLIVAIAATVGVYLS